MGTDKAKPVKLVIEFGALAPSLFEQIRLAGYTAPAGTKWLQEYADAITFLAVRRLLSEAETKRARKRVMKMIAGQVRPAQERR
jgi:hypothetical protein